MKRTTIYILLAFFAAYVLWFVASANWRAQRQTQYEAMVRHAERYAGATGDTVTAFDNRTDRWIAEMKEEPVEVILQKLTDGAEYIEPIFQTLFSVGFSTHSEEGREQTIYSRDIRSLLANRRFRKAYEDLQTINKTESAELLTQNIRDNLVELRLELLGYIDCVRQGAHKGNFGTTTVIPDVDSYRYSSHPDFPPTRFGRRHAVLSYIMLASLLELREVRPAIEEVVAFAKEEYRFFNSIEDGIGAGAFKTVLLRESLYNPSLLVTAAFCDPAWNPDKHKLLEAKLVEEEIVDWQARATEHDMLGREGWVPVVPHEGMLKIRYYQGITDAEFNDFFGKQD